MSIRMTITQIHRPALWEGGCEVCTAYYQRHTERILDKAFNSGFMIDSWVRVYFEEAHAHGGGHLDRLV